MKIFYSKSQKAFYDLDIHGDAMPKDVVEITKEEHTALLDGQSNGRDIATDKKGKPILVDSPALSAEENAEQFNANIIRQIEDLEREQQPRALREYLIDGNKTYLEALNTKIVELRSQLIK